MQIRFIGDVHGRFSAYKKIIKGCERSLQVGDFGVGFLNQHSGKPCQNPPYSNMAKGEHYFIRGNHDNPSVCKRHPFWISDGGYPFDRADIFCVGGAISIDRHLRTQGYNWWPDEELSYKELCSITDLYQERKPSIVVTHECPDSAISKTCYENGITKLDIPCTTRKCFDNFLEIHKPDVWIHGHWHLSSRMVYKGVDFISLNELEYIDLDI